MNNSVYENTIRKLSSGGIESPRLEARLLIADILKTSADNVGISTQLSQNLEKILEEHIAQRIAGKPLDKIIGRKGFYKFEFEVSQDVLSPRPETEILVEEALKIIKENKFRKVADFGLGSGCILLSLLKEIEDLQGMGIDASKKALKIAQKNAQGLGVEDKCIFLLKSWFDEDFFQALGENFDMIVSNPPYIKTDDIKTLDIGVQKYDPLLALDGGIDGLKDYLQIAKTAPSVLKKGGYILLEVGLGQALDVQKIFEEHGLAHISTLKDYAGIDRVVILRK
ncbi:MAG: peptide chain release factor N(5)-glutamine methyltransferase [Alphaproteobacteria bacterium]|nr:peptide chain release factor N(5)-glutamine methyltransferase [Alphaproteobacteria bacterium]